LLFSKIGYGFGEKESYIIYSALKKFVSTRNAPQVRFWGKIFGTKKDYYIIEADVELENQEEIQENHEPRKEVGVNKKTYFVTNDSNCF
jgi:radial spoke head protein 4A